MAKAWATKDLAVCRSLLSSSLLLYSNRCLRYFSLWCLMFFSHIRFLLCVFVCVICFVCIVCSFWNVGFSICLLHLHIFRKVVLCGFISSPVFSNSWLVSSLNRLLISDRSNVLSNRYVTWSGFWNWVMKFSHSVVFGDLFCGGCNFVIVEWCFVQFCQALCGCRLMCLKNSFSSMCSVVSRRALCPLWVFVFVLSVFQVVVVDRFFLAV